MSQERKEFWILTANYFLKCLPNRLITSYLSVTQSFDYLFIVCLSLSLALSLFLPLPIFSSFFVFTLFQFVLFFWSEFFFFAIACVSGFFCCFPAYNFRAFGFVFIFIYFIAYLIFFSLLLLFLICLVLHPKNSCNIYFL